jgi:putative endopeptidase
MLIQKCMKMKVKFSSLPWMVVLVSSVFTSVAQQEPSKAKFIDPANMDITVKPGDDFEKYAGGNWLRSNPVPAKETRWGRFTILRPQIKMRHPAP